MNPKQSFLQSLFKKAYAEKPKTDLQQFEIKNVLDAIAQNETSIVQGDKYAFRKPSGNPALGDDIGKYQVTEGELNSYAPRFFGAPLTGEQFTGSSTAQETYMKGKVKHYLDQGYTPHQIADIHRRGYKNSSDPGSEIYQDPEYVRKFNATYNTIPVPNPKAVQRIN